MILGAQVIVTLTVGTHGKGPMASDALQLLSALTGLGMTVLAVRRSGPYGKLLWGLVAAAISVWICGEAIIAWYEGVLHASILIPWPSDPLMFFWVFPIFLCLTVPLIGGKPRLDGLQLLDFLQLSILAGASYMVLLRVPSRWAAEPFWMAAMTWDITNVRDAALTVCLVARAYFSRGLARDLFIRISSFFVCYAVADFTYHTAEDIYGVTTGSVFDVIWTLPFVVLALTASTWDRRDESTLEAEAGGRHQRTLFFAAVFLPPIVVLLAMYLARETPLMGAVLAVGSLVTASFRLVMTQQRQEQSEQLTTTIYQISECSNSSGSLDELFAAIHSILNGVMYARNCYFALYDEEHATVSFPYYVDEKMRQRPEPRQCGRGLTEYVLRKKHPVLATPQVFDELIAAGEIADRGQIRPLGWIGVPLRCEDRTIGVLTVQTYTERNRYGEKEVEILTFVSQQVARAIEHRRNQDAVLESETKFRALAENALAGIFIREGERLLYVNPALEAMLGIPHNELLAMRNPFEGFQPEAEAAPAAESSAAGPCSLTAGRFELRKRTSQGKSIWLDCSLSEIEFRGRPAIVGVVVDVTEQKDVEEQLRQSQKMEAIGRLSGGIAHDFNNLLTVIDFSCELLRERVAADAYAAEQIGQIEDAAAKGGSLTNQLLAFSRRQVLQPRVINPNTAVRNLSSMLGRLIGEDIRLSTETAPDLGAVRIDPGQFDQVVLNLAVNARDAMPKGGTLTLETANVTLNEANANQRAGVVPGEYVMLAVSDTGQGMPPEVASRIFEPFFTTKENGKGTGLGLSTVYGIIRQSDGHIEFDSEPGHGSRFKVFLPRYSGAELEEPPERAERGPVLKSVEDRTILLVEDEPALQTLAKAILSSRGYTVLTARDELEVMAHCTEHGDKIDLLLTDVILPGTSGPAVAKMVLEKAQNAKVVFMSGYTDTAIEPHGVLDLGLNFLQKPFTPNALIAKIRKALADVS